MDAWLLMRKDRYGEVLIEHFNTYQEALEERTRLIEKYCNFDWDYRLKRHEVQS